MPSTKNNDLIVKGGLIALLIFLLRKAGSSAPIPGDTYGGEGNVPGSDGNNKVKSDQLSANQFKGRALKKGTYYFTIPNKGSAGNVIFLGYSSRSSAIKEINNNSIVGISSDRVKNNRLPTIEAKPGDVVGKIISVNEYTSNSGLKYLIYKYEPFNTSRVLYLVRSFNYNSNNYQTIPYSIVIN